jgi:hypothetical protein
MTDPQLEVESGSSALTHNRLRDHGAEGVVRLQFGAGWMLVRSELTLPRALRRPVALGTFEAARTACCARKCRTWCAV